jgi:hypothetical protein
VNPTHELAHEAWSEYLDAVSRELLNARVSIEIRPGSAARIDGAAPLALQKVGYERRDDLFELAAAQGGSRLPSLLTHMVDHPKRILVDSWTLLAPMTIAVDGGDGVRTVIKIAGECELARQ